MAKPWLFEVGQRVWSFDQNQRVYERDADGRATGGPIYAEHYRPHRVAGIEGQSYLIESGETWKVTEKVGRRKAERDYVDDRMMEDQIWRKDHLYKMLDLVRRADADVLRKIADLIGYDRQGQRREQGA